MNQHDLTDGQQSATTIGLVGLGVMGHNLALNMLDKGFNVHGLDQSDDKAAAFAQAAQAINPAAHAYTDYTAFVQSLPAPRLVVLMLPAGPIVDSACEALIAAGVSAADVVVDCGNSDWQDTDARMDTYGDRMTLLASGVSGGEVGARFGPSLMVSGPAAGWDRLRPVWEAIAALAEQGDDDTDPVCGTHLGDGAAGHFVKMVHNGIEYADMQLIGEAYQLLRDVLGYSPVRIGELFARWNQGPLAGYLVEITADILQTEDPRTKAPMVDVIRDATGQKGTGIWTVINAARLGSPAGLISGAVFARALSSKTDQRAVASTLYNNGTRVQAIQLDDARAIEEAVHDALYAGKICTYAQGFGILREASDTHGWHLQLDEVARIWRGGCVIRAALLNTLRSSLQETAGQDNLLLSEAIVAEISPLLSGWRQTVGLAVRSEVPIPAMSAGLAYFDGFKSARLPAALLQAQRDYFGAHTYQRTDDPLGQSYHLTWHGSPRREVGQ